jgi:hypothetical protein
MLSKISSQVVVGERTMNIAGGIDARYDRAAGVS